MTRKSYNELAADLKNLREASNAADSSGRDLRTVDRTIDVVIEALQRDSSHFDKTRFLNAIGR